MPCRTILYLLEAPEVMCCALFRMLEVAEVMRCVLHRMPEAVEGRLYLLEVAEAAEAVWCLPFCTLAVWEVLEVPRCRAVRYSICWRHRR